ncbi:Transcription factor E2F8 [Frankliniella fusca]|uniref:Transcription factor E2F8 n=1 Tax=Frankliniella fusca TaxID=407009 RepID=A0AAE1HTI5_9NEOP|nr:Transcription factor E2F8 [Frankliniella fusca]
MMRSPERKALSTLCNNIPISPTANLKLLTKVASELVSPVPHVETAIKSTNSKETSSRTRKDKSLGILCDKFLAMFPLNLPEGCQVMEICLDQVAEQLGIVKRRIYDIINILESLHMASKVAKNRYHWHGCKNLQATLSQLKAMAIEYGINEKLQNIHNKQKSGPRLASGPTCCCTRDLLDPSVGSAGDDSDKSGPDGFFSDERTLGVMCLKFIMLFLSSHQPSPRVNLDLATRMLVSEAAETTERRLWGMKVDCHRNPRDKPCDLGSKTCKCMLRLKTKVRRLYDIANVLTSLGLITKIETSTNLMRKPVFVYTGPLVRITSGQNVQSFSFKSFVSSNPSEEDEGVENKLNIKSKRKDSKFKGGPPEKIPRIASDLNIGVQIRQCETSSNVSARHVSGHPQYQCSLDDILQVAGLELEKIRSSEELEAAQKISNARKKLSFSRFHSDSCIPPHNTSQTGSYKKEYESGQLVGNTIKEEVSGSESFKNVCITLSDSKSKRFTITRKLVEVPVHAIPQKMNKDAPFNLCNITPMQAQTLSTLFGMSKSHIQNNASKSDSNQILVSSQADIVNNNKPIIYSVKTSNKPVVNATKGSATSPATQGELFRAIKVGNVVHLVPFVPSAVNKTENK